jgi:hypothetical protein
LHLIFLSIEKDGVGVNMSLTMTWQKRTLFDKEYCRGWLLLRPRQPQHLIRKYARFDRFPSDFCCFPTAFVIGKPKVMDLDPHMDNHVLHHITPWEPQHLRAGDQTGKGCDAA